MDPVTLFALANGAVSAVKAGCKLYKDIKSAAGDVKDVLKDLDDQFHKRWEGKAVPVEAKNQYIQLLLRRRRSDWVELRRWWCP